MIGPGGFMAAPKPIPEPYCDCPKGKCEPRKCEGCRCFLSGMFIPVGYFKENGGEK